MSAEALLIDDAGLPGDIWLEVAMDADPLDVISLSQTCRSLHDILATTSLWKAIVRQVTRQTGPFIASYSLDDLTIDGLQRAATGPDRWRRFTLTGPSPELQDTGTPTLDAAKQIRDCTATLGPRRSGNIYRFVPGGRFLLIAGVKWEGEPTAMKTFAEVVLWDLGPYNTASGMEPVQVASRSIEGSSQPGRFDLQVDLCITAGTQLLVVMCFLNQGKGKRSGVVLRLSLESQDPSF